MSLDLADPGLWAWDPTFYIGFNGWTKGLTAHEGLTAGGNC